MPMSTSAPNFRRLVLSTRHGCAHNRPPTDRLCGGAGFQPTIFASPRTPPRGRSGTTHKLQLVLDIELVFD